MTLFIILILCCILLAAFFSGSETALTGASEAKIHKLKSEGSKRAEKVSELVKDKDKLISSLMVGNNAVNISASTLTTLVILHNYGEYALPVATLILTLLIIIFGEILPKTYAFENSEKFALAVAKPVSIVMKVLSPINYFIQKIVGFVMIPLRRDNGKGETDLDAKDVLRGTIDFHHEEGEFIKEDKHMLGSILDLESITLANIMHHRKDMLSISLATPVDEIVSQMLEGSFSRVPVYKNKTHNVIGILHIKTLMRALYAVNNDASKIDIETIMTAPWFVPENTTLKDQLANFREKRQHFAIAVDEYGEITGFITLEDILEEIVGNIEDEYDIKHHTLIQQEDGSYIVDGTLTIRDLNRELDFDLSTEYANTVAGFIISETEIIPDVGQIFSINGSRFEILKKKGNQITKIKISATKEKDDALQN